MLIRFSRFALSVSFIFILLAATQIGLCDADNSTGRAVSAENKVAYTGRPSVVMITNEYKGTLVGKDTGLSEAYFSDIRVNLPEFYIGSQGSGFIVSSDGYIVTNAHVVNYDENAIMNEFATQAANYVANSWLELYDRVPEDESSHDPYYYSYTQNWQDNYDFFMNKYEPEYIQEIRVFFGTPVGGVVSPEGYPAEIRKLSPQKLWLTYGDYVYRSGKDLAVIKIEGADNLPTALLCDSAYLRVGDKIIVIGYPGTASSSMTPYLSPETNLVPTVTSGIVSAIRKLPDGSDVIQTDAAIFHGNSGGPAFDEYGRVVGVATFASGKNLVSGDWIDIQGYNFLVPINVAKSLMTELNINTTPSETTQHFNDGMDYYWSGRYTEARGEFNTILNLDPSNLYASDYIKMSMKRG